jgi:DNA-binding MarR family transcriptional regulator
MKSRQLEEIKVEPQNVGLEQPLGRFLILLFRKFEDELLESLSAANYQDISSSDLNVLRNIESQGKPMVEIARLSGVTKQAISKQVRSLIDRGYLRLDAHDSDKRAVLVRFSTKGEAMIRTVITIIAKIEVRYSGHLGVRNFKKLKQDLLSLIRT